VSIEESCSVIVITPPCALQISIQQAENVEANQAEAEAKAKEKHKNLSLERYSLPKSRLFFLASAFAFALIRYTCPTSE
jgi:hypothetical protein